MFEILIVVLRSSTLEVLDHSSVAFRSVLFSRKPFDSTLPSVCMLQESAIELMRNRRKETDPTPVHSTRVDPPYPRNDV